jgi:hypothetical protein
MKKKKKNSNNKKRKKMRDNVVGDILYDRYLQYFILNRILSEKMSVPITNEFMMKKRPDGVTKIWHAYLTSNFHAHPHPGMSIKNLLDDKFL